MATRTIARELTSKEALDIGEYKLGSFGSDLNDFVSTLEHVTNQPTTMEEYLEGNAPGDTFGVSLDRARLAELVVFASDAIETAAAITGEATKLREEALALRREQMPDEEFREYRRA